jgi:hypothetical protein
MSKEAIARRKKEILESIADPVVREHYRVRLDEAEQLEEEEGVVTAFHEVFEDEPYEPPQGGIFVERPKGGASPTDVFGQPTVIRRPDEEAGKEVFDPVRIAWLNVSLGIVIGAVVALLAVWLLGKL